MKSPGAKAAEIPSNFSVSHKIIPEFRQIYENPEFSVKEVK